MAILYFLPPCPSPLSTDCCYPLLPSFRHPLGSSINHVVRFLYFLTPFPTFVVTYTDYGLCNKTIIWHTLPPLSYQRGFWMYPFLSCYSLVIIALSLSEMHRSSWQVYYIGSFHLLSLLIIKLNLKMNVLAMLKKSKPLIHILWIP